MPAATVTEIDDATTTPGTNYVTYGGTWSALTGQTGGQTNGTYHSSSTATSTATVNFSGKALYGIFVKSGSAIASVTIDGAAYSNYLTDYSLPTNGQRIVIPIARNLSDAAHVAVITLVSGTFFGIDGFFVISGAKGTPTTGNYVALGDSWTNGGGAVAVAAYYPNQINHFLGMYYKRPITIFNKGVNGDSWYGTTSSLFGGLWRLNSDVFANTPEFLTILFGVNDLRQGAGLLDYNRNLFSALCLIEDALDTSQVKVVVGTPGFVTPTMRILTPATQPYGTMDVFEEAVYSTRQICAAFSWVKVAGIYEALDGRSECMVPNNAADFGLHPNDFGHAVVANEFFRTLVGING